MNLNSSKFIVLYELISFSYPHSIDDLLEEIQEKVSRLLDVKKMAFIASQKEDYKLLTYLGFTDNVCGKSLIKENMENVFLYEMVGGKAGYLYIKQEKPITRHEKKLYTIFASTIADIYWAKKMEKDKQRIIHKRQQEKTLLLDNLPIHVWHLKNPRTYGQVNRRHAHFWGKKVENMENCDIYNIYSENEALKQEKENQIIFKKGEKIENKKWWTDSEGIKRLFLIKKTPLRTDSSEIKSILCTAEDITDKYEIQEKLGLQQAYFKQLFSNSLKSIILIDKNLKIIEANKMFSEIINQDKRKISNKRFTEVLEKMVNNKKKINKLENKIAAGKMFEKKEISFSKNNNEKKFYTVMSFPVNYSGKRVGSFVVFHDITERKLFEKRLAYISFHDQLTGLYNRSFLEKEIKKFDNKKYFPISVIMADLNGLKLTNDAFGHHQGDQLLKKAAEIMKSLCRKKDLIARWGGDEFLIFLPRTEKNITKKIIERIKKNCNKDLIKPLPVSLSIGCAVKEKENQKIHHIIQKAEERMYHKKLKESRKNKKRIIETLLKTLAGKTHEDETHIEYLKKLAIEYNKKIKMSNSEFKRLIKLIETHDIGMVTISEKIINKKGKLNKKEWKQIKKHPETGYRIVSYSEDYAAITKEILHHHENWDGSGYPTGLSGENIPFLSRVFTLLDAYAAMTSERKYQDKVSIQQAKNEIKNKVGSQFDPELVKIFIND